MLAGLAANLMLAGRSSESIPFALRAIDQARAVGAQGIEARALEVLGINRAALGDIAGGIVLLREALGIATAASDPMEVPRSHANLSTVLEMGGFVEEALAVSLAGADVVRLYGGEFGFGVFLAVNAAAMLIELGRYDEAADLLERQTPNVRPGVSTFHFHVTFAHLGVRTGDLALARRHLDIAEAEAAHVEDAQYSIDLATFRTEIALWGGDPAAAVDVARQAFDRLVDLDDAVILGQLAIPATHAAADLADMARAARNPSGVTEAVGVAREMIDSYRSSTARLEHPDALATHEIGWRMAICEAELGRAGGTDDAAQWDAIGPALVARPAPFLEAYVLFRAAEALAGARQMPEAAARLRAAHDICRRIGASLLEAAVQSLARRLRIDLEPGAAVSRGSGPGNSRAGRPVRPDRPRARGPGVGRRGLHEPPDRRDAVHQREHGRRPRLEHPGQARRGDEDRGRGRGGAPRAGRHGPDALNDPRSAAPWRAV